MGNCSPALFISFKTVRDFDKNKMYKCEKTGEVYSGALLMNSGINLSRVLKYDGESIAMHFVAI